MGRMDKEKNAKAPSVSGEDDVGIYLECMLRTGETISAYPTDDPTHPFFEGAPYKSVTVKLSSKDAISDAVKQTFQACIDCLQEKIGKNTY